jgi:hypothetical protein
MKYIANYNVQKFGTLKKKFVEPGRNQTCPCGSGKKVQTLLPGEGECTGAESGGGCE